MIPAKRRDLNGPGESIATGSSRSAGDHLTAP
jgi:hypothetical protein